ncbi:hypothetical protein FGO68_gene4516 [Halteria grandinella]|uniref:Uncharacterized protein n=1 Tax=Halteria grandinella TaxID=5974 RepID=A0A8J8NJJ9_HALGN|nr:hypothetical protein FGO68_gene4516 [Halteria grandinella]
MFTGPSYGIGQNPFRDHCPLFKANHNIGPGHYSMKTPSENQGICFESKYKSNTSAKISKSQFTRQTVNMSHLRSSVQVSGNEGQSK